MGETELDRIDREALWGGLETDMSCAEKRIATLRRHLVSGGSSLIPEEGQDATFVLNQSPIVTDEAWDSTEDVTKSWSFDVADHLCGPLKDAKYKGDAGKKQVVREWQYANATGTTHLLWSAWQRAYGDAGLATNIAMPWISFSRYRAPVITHQVLLADPEDCARIARTHVRKSPNFTMVFGESIISTQDNDHWRRQREGLVEAFLPTQSLAKIFQISVARASKCAERLRGLALGGREVDFSDFYLHEAQAQLQLALFGAEETWMEENNAKIREAFAGFSDVKFIQNFCMELLRPEALGVESPFASPREVASGAALEVKGPLTKRVVDSGEPRLTQFGNAIIFAFAGHDTTGHTMTWMTYELAKRPDLQRRLQAEVDTLFDDLERNHDGRPLAYSDLHRLPFMTQCVMETLRLWPAVPNGTYRELQFDDYIKGPGGREVKVPKGTYVQVLNWPRHRNPDLWGADVDEFNPDRDFTATEMWDHTGFTCWNPATPRFSPFTFPPRDCIGKNFAQLTFNQWGHRPLPPYHGACAQMEMRAILGHLFREFDFSLGPTLNAIDTSEVGRGSMGVNRGTMGPKNFSEKRFSKKFKMPIVTLAMPLVATPRR